MMFQPAGGSAITRHASNLSPRRGRDRTQRVSSMLFELFCDLVFFALVAFWFAWPIAARLVLPPVEKIVVSVSLSLLGIFLVAWIIYVTELPWALCWLLPVATLVGIVLNRR